jgi:hypothetical protein
MEWLRDWWAVLTGAAVGFFGGVLWVGKVNGEISGLQKDVADLQAEKFVELSACEERRRGCGRSNQIQFDHGTSQFVEIKKLIADIDRAGNDRHNEMMKTLLEMNRHG